MESVKQRSDFMVRFVLALFMLTCHLARPSVSKRLALTFSRLGRDLWRFGRTSVTYHRSAPTQTRTIRQVRLATQKTDSSLGWLSTQKNRTGKKRRRAASGNH